MQNLLIWIQKRNYRYTLIHKVLNNCVSDPFAMCGSLSMLSDVSDTRCSVFSIHVFRATHHTPHTQRSPRRGFILVATEGFLTARPPPQRCPNIDHRRLIMTTAIAKIVALVAIVSCSASLQDTPGESQVLVDTAAA